MWSVRADRFHRTRLPPDDGCNLVRAGVPDTIAMNLTSHKNRAVFDRNSIVDEADLRTGVAKLAEHLNPALKSPKGTRGGQLRIQ